jgi:hypothetical protein
MNCKPGEIAIRVSAPSGAWIPVGSIVQVVNFSGPGSVSRKLGSRWVSDLWDVEFRGSETNHVTGAVWAVPDSDLRPIRGSDEVDEMLRIAGLPNKQPEVA